MIGTQWDGSVESNDIKRNNNLGVSHRLSVNVFGNTNSFSSKCIKHEVNNIKQSPNLNPIHRCLISTQSKSLYFLSLIFFLDRRLASHYKLSLHALLNQMRGDEKMCL